MFPGREDRKATVIDPALQVELDWLIEAIQFGTKAKQRLSLRRVVELGAVHPTARQVFAKTWLRHISGQMMRETVDDDALFFRALRILLPPSTYCGPDVPLFRGQLDDEPIGISWTHAEAVALKFALFGRAKVNPNKLLEAIKRGKRVRASGVFLRAMVPASRIICDFKSWEHEVVVDIRGVDVFARDIGREITGGIQL